MNFYGNWRLQHLPLWLNHLILLLGVKDIFESLGLGGITRLIIGRMFSLNKGSETPHDALLLFHSLLLFLN